MDGYLGLLEQRMDKMQAQLDAHNAVLKDQLAAKAKADAEAAKKAAADKQAAAEKEKAEVAARIKKREADKAAAVEAAKGDAEKKYQDELRAQATEQHLAQMRAQAAAKTQGGRRRGSPS